MSYQKDRDEFLTTFARHVPKATHSDALLLLRAATGEQRHNEITSSLDVGERELARLDRQSERRLARVRALCLRLDCRLVENGDPRGFAFLIAPPDGYANDWGQRGIGVPGRGLPARCFS